MQNLIASQTYSVPGVFHIVIVKNSCTAISEDLQRIIRNAGILIGHLRPEKMRGNKEESFKATSKWSKFMQKLRSMSYAADGGAGSLQCYRDVRYALVMNGKPKQEAAGASGHRTGSKISVNRP